MLFDIMGFWNRLLVKLEPKYTRIGLQYEILPSGYGLVIFVIDLRIA